MNDKIGEELGDLQEIKDTKVAPAQGIAAIALSMALKYHGMMMIPDGLTYQQFKMEGRNIREIGLHDVFDTAIKIESHLLGADARIQDIILGALVEVDEEDVENDQEAAHPQT